MKNSVIVIETVVVGGRDGGERGEGGRGWGEAPGSCEVNLQYRSV